MNETSVIQVRDAGIRFRLNRRSRRSFKDLFAGRKRRARANEFWALRNVSFDVTAGEAIGVVHPVSFDCAEFGEVVYGDEHRAITV